MSRPPRHAEIGRRARLDPLEPRLLLDAAALLGASTPPGVRQPAQISPQPSTQSLAEMHVITGVDVAQTQYGLTGVGQTVVVIDSGVAYDHPALGGGFGPEFRVVGGWDFTAENDADPYDDAPAGFHGTHVAGIIGSSDDEHLGVAPDVDLVALRIFDDQGRGKLAWLESSLNWVLDHIDAFAHPITTVNLSLGTDWNSTTLPDYAILEDEFQQLHDAGVFVAAAAGNQFDADHPGLSYPAVSPYVVPVASVDAGGQLSRFSQRSPLVLAAPGEQITSTVPDYLADFNGVTDDFHAASGTSMASPYLAGASVLVRQAMQQAGEREITVDAVRDVLVESAQIILDPSTGQSYARLDVAAAVRRVLGTPTLTHHDGLLVIEGTAADDVIQFEDDGRVIVNRRTYQLAPGTFDRVRIDGGEGRDQLKVFSSRDSARVQLAPGSFQLSATGVLWTGGGLERIEVFVDGDGATAVFQDGPGLDKFVAKPSHSWMENEAYLNYVRGAATVVARSGGGGDLAVLYDGPGADQVTLRPSTGNLRGAGYDNQAFGFAQVAVRGLAGGADQATIVGSPGADVVRSTALDVSIRHAGEFQYLVGVEDVTVYGNGGLDTARLEDGPGDDLFVAEPAYHRMESSSFTRRLHGFSRVEAFASAGFDVAEFQGGTDDESFTAKPTHSWLENAAQLSYARGYDEVHASGGGGRDSALLYDSAGPDAVQLGPTFSRFTGPSFRYEVAMFTRVQAFSRQGADTAVFLDSDATDRFFAGPQASWMLSAQVSNIAQGFGHVSVPASHGDDLALLADSAGNDLLQVSADRLTWYGVDFRYDLAQFARVVARSTQGQDRLVVDGVIAQGFRRSQQGWIWEALDAALVADGFELA